MGTKGPEIKARLMTKKNPAEKVEIFLLFFFNKGQRYMFARKTIMTLKKGDSAPNFKLFNTEKKEIQLSDFRGKNLIIHFFPMAFTGVCTTQLCSVRDAIQLYRNENCDVVGISVDSLFTLSKFKSEQNLPFELLSDFNKETCQAYGAFIENFAFGMRGVAQRAAFIVDKEGKIAYAQVLPSPGDLPDFKAIDKVLEEIS
ncbi:MAG: hypothetical protein RLZZ46_1441 [Bacteroidota bacterium]|jgi:peroxiredoxin